MGRIRTVKPEFFTSEDVVDMPHHVRLLYIALWCEADRDGRLVWKPRTFKMRYFPVDSFDIDEACEHLVSTEHVVLYGDGLAYIPTFLDHQHINPRESKSTLPSPFDDDASATREPRVKVASVTVHPSSVTRREEGEGKEGKQDASGDASVKPRTQSASRFAEFWQAWPAGPRKQAKAECEKKWKSRRLDDIADEIVRHVRELSETKQFKDFTPAPLTYLNQRRWEDGSPSGDECTSESSPFRGAL
ncbi:MAG: hypothetical protein ABFD89_23655 [Bryobacteraceae bacterium]